MPNGMRLSYSEIEASIEKIRYPLEMRMTERIFETFKMARMELVIPVLKDINSATRFTVDFIEWHSLFLSFLPSVLSAETSLR
jgi:hypothetical protein